MPAHFSFDVSITKKHFIDLEARLKETAGRTLYQFAEEVMAESKEIVPVDTGALMNSGYVAPPEEAENVISVKMGYGGPSVDYAGAVHEDMSPRHWHRPGSGPKYLERPLVAKQADLPQLLADTLKEALNTP